MAIEMNDPYGGGQPDVSLGRSTLPVRETYTNPAAGAQARYSEQMSSADQIVRALSSLSSTFKEQGEKQQALVDQQAKLNIDLNNGANDLVNNGNTPGGVVSKLYPGGGSPDGMSFNPSVSPGAQMQINHQLGARDAARFITEDPVIAQINANEALKLDPKAYNEALRTRLTQLEQEKSNARGGGAMGSLYRGGIASTFRSFADKQSAEAFQSSVNEIRKINDESGQRALNEAQPKTATQLAAVNAVKALGGDPAKLYQFVGLENQQWDNHAVSSNGSVGLTQINDARYATIIERLKREGRGDLAAKLTDRTDPAQNAALWAVEYDYNSKQAKAVLGRDPSTAEVYMYWQQPAKAEGILRNQDALVRDAIAPNVIKANPSIYGDGNMTVKQMLANVNQRANANSEVHTQYHDVRSAERRLITQDTWSDSLTQNGYKWTDFKNSGQYGGKGQVDSRTVMALDQLSTFMGRKIGVTSAHRDDAYNADVTGTTTKNHQTGDSFDIDIKNPEDQKKAAQFLASIGARGIGVYNGHMHFDFGTGRPNQAKDVNTWSKGGLDQASLDAAVASGRANASNGNYMRATGFQGKPMDPMENQIRMLQTQYGIPPSKGREMVMKSFNQSALNMAYRGDAAGAQALLASGKNTFGAMSAEEELGINRSHQSVNEIQTALRSRKTQQDTFEASEALNGQIKAAEEHDEKNKGAGPYQLDESKFPATVQGHEAKKAARAILLNIGGIDADTSGGNLIQAKSEISGDYNAFAKKYGFEDGSKVTPAQLKAAIYQQSPRQFTPAHINDLLTTYEGHRQAAPQAVGEAQTQSKIFKAEIESMFPMNSGAIAAITEANARDKLIQGSATDPYSATREISKYVGMTDTFFQQNYAARHKAEMMGNNGVPLSGTQKDTIARAALESTRIYAQSLATLVEANKADMAKVGPAAFSMQNPAQQFDATVMAAEKVRLGEAGLVAANVKYPGVPQGSFVMIDNSGKPQMTPDGSYRMMTAGNEPFYFKPQYNVVPQGAPQPTEAPAELQPPAAPAAPAAPAQPADANLAATRQFLQSHPPDALLRSFALWLKDQGKGVANAMDLSTYLPSKEAADASGKQVR
jgi:hypothetical protein